MEHELRQCRIIDGTAVAQSVLSSTAERVRAFEAASGSKPCLAAVLVGDDPASVTYVRMKRNRSRQVGIESRLEQLPHDATTEQVVATVRALSDDARVHGILLQHPVPDHIDERAAFEAISPSKDVDGVTMTSFAAMALGVDTLASSAPAGILRLLDAYKVSLDGAHAVVIGRSPILGKPVGMLLLARNATLTYCHSHTADLPNHVRSADVVVAGVGIPRFVRGDWIKSGAVVIDAGYNPGNVGDVHFEEASARAALITPVPGGVGPMTIAVLLEQTVTAAEATVRTQR